jgi:hypothetical protein
VEARTLDTVPVHHPNQLIGRERLAPIERAEVRVDVDVFQFTNRPIGADNVGLEGHGCRRTREGSDDEVAASQSRRSRLPPRFESCHAFSLRLGDCFQTENQLNGGNDE